MTVRELITELEKCLERQTLDSLTPVCGQSETQTWDIKPEDLVATPEVLVEDRKIYPFALILGYKH